MKSFFEFTPTPKEVMTCVVSEFQWLSLLKGKNKPYETLIHFVEQTGQLENEDEDYYDKNGYQVSSIAKELSESPARIRKWIFSIYDDLLMLNQKEPQLFNNGNPYHYVLSFESSYGYYNEFNIWLPIMLNYSDSFHFDFINGKVNTWFFWVKRITVQHHNGKTRVEVDLKEGIHNKYKELVFDKADLLDTYSFNELYNSNLYDVYKKIKEYARREKL